MRTPTRRSNARSTMWLAIVLSLTAAAATATETVGGAAESIDGAARLPAVAAKPRIGRIFFSPAERARRGGGLAAGPRPAAPISAALTGGAHAAVRQRRVVNGALSSSTQGRVVWVNGTAVENSVRDKSAWTDRNGNVWLMNGTQGTHLVKPGQSIDRNGVIEDLLPAGAVAPR
jgi:hypothetical protein